MLTDRQLQRIFYGLWTAVLIGQAAITGLLNDEAYYWKYSDHLSWGYFDHPPAVALLVKCGDWFWHHPLGVRLFSILMSVATIAVLEWVVKPKNKKLFYALIAAIGVFQIGGMLAVPDIPLTFFSLLFVVVAQRFFEQDNWKNALLFALLAACLMYSKYHGAIIILIVVLYRWKLLLRHRFYVATILAVALFLPHLWWQYGHHFPTFWYHLVDRSSETYRFKNTYEYLLSQLIVPGPFVGVVLLHRVFTRKADGGVGQLGKAVIFGVYGFFLLSSFKDTIEANWTIALVPLLVMCAYPHIEGNAKTEKWIYRLSAVTIILIIPVRLFMAGSSVFPEKWYHKSEVHYWQEWASAIHKHAQGRPVVFTNTYQKASKYEFYTGDLTHSLTSIHDRNSHYDMLPVEDSLQGKEVFFIPNWDNQQRFSEFRTRKERVRYIVIPNYRSYSKVRLMTPETSYRLQAGSIWSPTIAIRNDFSIPIDPEANPDMRPEITYHFFIGTKLQKSHSTGIYLTRAMLDRGVADLDIELPKEPGNYIMRISVKCGWMTPTINGHKIHLELE